MIMADVLKIVFLIIGVFSSITCYWLATEALFPNFVIKARQRYKKPIILTFLGLLVVAIGGAIGAVTKSIVGNSGDPIIILLLCIFVFFGLLGSSGLCQLVGMGMPSPVDETQPWRRTLRAGIVLSFVFLLPGPGWLIMAWSGISGCGAMVLSFFNTASSVNSA
ncbi:hypothetical protein CMK10_08415 [Candidatus Poribacteria bacterium]|jgi:hypothetical protein|nr:hypothetical protein [Candidatus Poribacteria bacterium]MBT20820.1 hypothetical protein [Candidatus Poribacteria bacterium]|tara:strand:+ start:288 stop:779 length:492 start_codon:yes stop_codon:yes gene_type:complete